MQTVTILGSTGSIGKNTIKVMNAHPEKFKTVALVAKSNVELLAKQAIALNAELAVIADKSLYNQLKHSLSGSGVRIEAGEDAVVEAAKMPGDIVMSAIVGSAGLAPTMAALQRGAKVALANKECLVCAGNIMTDAAKKYGATIIPVDSEHSAIFQVFDFKNPENIEKIILTASGGPFFNMEIEQMRHATPAQAVAHPNWSMGAKISVDSATMMNKGLEVIEAFHLFPVAYAQIEVVVHPESVVHSLVEYVDGSILAQLGTPDMCTPIALALAWPGRLALSHPKLNLAQIGQLNFKPVAKNRFPAIDLCYCALAKGGNIPAALSTANEVAVSAFLSGRIGFLDIVHVVEKTLTKINYKSLTAIEQVIETITEAKYIASEIILSYTTTLEIEPPAAQGEASGAC
jgi:1-deoxy-D-xylulose-5-phosphate reductoisomerase